VKIKKKTYVHCINGHGRSTVLVAAYLISKGKTVKKVLELIKQKRPSIHLEKIQKEALDKYAKNTCNETPYKSYNPV